MFFEISKILDYFAFISACFCLIKKVVNWLRVGLFFLAQRSYIFYRTLMLLNKKIPPYNLKK